MAYMAGVEIPDAEVHHHALVRLLAELGTNASQDARTIGDTIVTSDLAKSVLVKTPQIVSGMHRATFVRWHHLRNTIVL